MAMDEYTFFRTTDIYFAAYLCAIDISLESTDRSDDSSNNKVVFIFKIPKKDFERIKSGFFGGGATVKVQNFIQSYRNLKTMCFVYGGK